MTNEPLFAHPHKRLERAIFFSDAVFAIAITLLALEVKLPHEAEHEPFAWHALEPVVPNLVACATSFWLIGISWWSHTRFFERLHAIDGKLLALNLARLFFVTMIPFPTGILAGGNGTPASWCFYALVNGASGGCQWWMWLYAGGKPALVGNVTAAERRAISLRLAIMPLLFLVSATCSIWSFHAGWISLTVLSPLQAFVGRAPKKA